MLPGPRGGGKRLRGNYRERSSARLRLRSLLAVLLAALLLLCASFTRGPGRGRRSAEQRASPAEASHLQARELILRRNESRLVFITTSAVRPRTPSLQLCV